MNDFHTEWEAQQYAADHGQSGAIAQGYRDLAAYIDHHGTEDTDVARLRIPAKPQAHMVPVIHGSDEERRGAVDRFAELRGVRAFWDEGTGTYRAVKWFGPVAYVVYMFPDGHRAQHEAPATLADAPELSAAAA